MTKSKEDNSLNGLVNEYVKLIFNLLCFFPIDLTLIKKFVSGHFKREDYNKDILTNFKYYIHFYLIYLFSIIIGLWWVFLAGSFILIPLLILVPNGLIILLISIPVLLLLFVISLIIGLIYFYFKSLLYKMITSHYGGDLTFNEVGTLIIYSSIVYLIFSVPIIFSYSLFIGFLFSPIISILSFYVLYVIYKELVNVFKMESNKAFYAVVISFAIEYTIFSLPALLLYLIVLLLRI